MKDTIGYADACLGLIAGAWSDASELGNVDALANGWWGARTWDLYRDSTLRTPGSTNSLFDAGAVDSRDIDPSTGLPFGGPGGSMQFVANAVGLHFVLALSGEFGDTGSPRQGWSAYYLFDNINIDYDDPAIFPGGSDGLLRFRIGDPSMNMTIDRVSMYIADMSSVSEPSTVLLALAALGLALSGRSAVKRRRRG